MKKISVAVIGSGSMAREHIRTIKDFSSFEIKGIFSRNFDTADGLAFEFKFPPHSDSINDLYISTKADFVVVAVPEMATEDIMNEVIKYPWVSLVEKPVGYDLQVAKRIHSSAQESGHTSFVGLNRRHYGSTSNLRSELEKHGTSLRNIRINDQQNLLQAVDMGQPEVVVSNWHFANSIHILDYVGLLARGSIESLSRYSNVNDYSSTGLVSAFVVYSSGDTVQYSCQINSQSAWSINVNCGPHEWELKPLEQLRYRDLSTRVFEEFEIGEVERQFKPGFHSQIKEVLNYFEGKAYYLPTLKDGIITMELIDAIFRK
jgi:predicted dehydrogenase